MTEVKFQKSPAGGTNTMNETNTLYKLMILYMLEKIDFSMTYGQIQDFVLGKGYTSYFVLQSSIADLLESDLIHAEKIRNTSYYSITPEGEDTIRYFRSKLSLPIRSDIDQYLKDNKIAIIDAVSVVADFYRTTNDDFEVRCLIREKKSNLIDLKMTVTDEEQAASICRQWRSKSAQVYEYLIQELMQQ